MLRFLIICTAIAAAMSGASRAFETVVPAGQTRIESRMLLAAASPAFLACKAKCYEKYKCEGIPAEMTQAKTDCHNKRKACVSACPK